MKGALASIALIFSTVLLSAQEFNPMVHGRMNEVPFEQFAHELQESYGIRCFYRPEWMEGVTLTMDADSMDLKRLLSKNIYKHELVFTLEAPARLYIYQGRRLVEKLPNFVVQDANPEANESADGTLSEVEQRYLQGRQADMVEIIVVGNPRPVLGTRPVTVSGRILSSETGEPVPGATMLVEETGKGGISDVNGNVSLAMRPGTYTARFSFVGMATQTASLQVHDEGRFTLELDPELIALEEVEVVGNENRKVEGTVMGVERINVNAVKQIPVMMGDRDIIKVSQLLPGITSASEASTGVNVRGGYVDQNMFYFEDVPLYNTSHSFGFFSAFNADMVRDFTIYKGNIPAMYGGRLSSVFDISARKGSLKRYTAHAGISPISANLTLEGPIVKNRASVLVSARSSYSDWLLRRIEDPLIRNSSASFYDVAASVYVKLSDKDDLNLFLYNSRDSIGLYELSNYKYSNQGASLRWYHHYTPSFSSDLSLVYSAYNFNVESIEVPSTAYSQAYRIGHNEMKLNFKWLKGLNHEINFGGNAIYYPLDRGDVVPLGEASNRVPIHLGKEQGIQTGLYVSDKIQLGRRLTVYLGARLNSYTYLGPQDVNVYAEGMEKTLENVEEVVNYDKGERIVTHHDPVLRAGLNLKMAQNTSLKLSFSQMNQYLFMASNTVTVAPDDQWKLADPHLLPQDGTQYSAGIYKYFPDLRLDASLEVYRKENHNVLEYKDGADFVNVPKAELSILQGDQSTHGAEFMLEKKSGRLTGWLSYTYSRSMITVDGDEPWEQINGGDPYPSNFDKPHLANFVATYRINRIYALSTSVVYSTGRPITLPESVYYYQGQPYISFSDRNSERVPDYFRADVSLTIEGNLKSDKFFHSTWIFNVYNMTGRDNVQSVYFRSEEGIIKGYKLSIIGVPIFTVTWNLKLGNYAAK